MTTSLDDLALPRPAAAADPGPLDERLYDLVETRLRRLLRDNPILATYLGIHTEDERLGDGSRDAVLQELADEREHLAAVEALDPAGLSEDGRFERDLELHNVRQQIYQTDVVRTWERRATALDTAGDAIFLLFVRDFAPLAERLQAIAARLEELPGFIEQSKSRAVGPQVRLWQQIEIDSARDLPGLFGELQTAADGVLQGGEHRRLAKAVQAATEATEGYRDWITGTLADATDEWALGRDRYDGLIEHRAFDGLTADEIFEIGQEQLREQRRMRREAAYELDPDTDEPTVLDRIKRDHPATFEEALEGYRDAMFRSRQYLIDHDIATVPDDERVEVVATPGYLRRVIPFAAYFESPPLDRTGAGIYIVTPSVDGDPNAMREHNRASISNTSIHEAYPGHHLQLTVGGRHPSLSRLLANAPEFVEGWGMYSEQLMREVGFDDGPAFRVMMHTDAIWRACRIILDVRMHRGELTAEEATDFLIEHTGFEEANARAEVKRYTYTPTYPLSYLLGKVLILGLRDAERQRLGDAFRLKDFHDTLLRAGSLPISFHRRLLERSARAAAPAAAE
jgi:uncharacterized protein (DUF885 family)